MPGGAEGEHIPTAEEETKIAAHMEYPVKRAASEFREGWFKNANIDKATIREIENLNVFTAVSGVDFVGEIKGHKIEARLDHNNRDKKEIPFSGEIDGDQLSPQKAKELFTWIDAILQALRRENTLSGEVKEEEKKTMGAVENQRAERALNEIFGSKTE